MIMLLEDYYFGSERHRSFFYSVTMHRIAPSFKKEINSSIIKINF